MNPRTSSARALVRATACACPRPRAGARSALVAALYASVLAAACSEDRLTPDATAVPLPDVADASDAVDVLDSGALDVADEADAVEVVDAPDSAELDTTAELIEVGDADGGCTSVCFEWVDLGELGPVSPESTHPELVGACNLRGIYEGQCPSGFSCVDPGIRWFSTGVFASDPRCEGDAAVYELSFDLADARAKGVSVMLAFRMNGGAWPAGPPGSAGTMRLRDRATGARLTVNVPTSLGGRLELDLEPGLYDVAFEPAGTMGPEYPTIPAVGVLEVVAPGLEIVPVYSGRIRWTVSLGGTVYDLLPSGMDELQLAFSGDSGAEARARRAGSERLVGEEVVWPGTYDVVANAYGSGATRAAPVGAAAYDGQVRVEVGAVVDVQLDFPTARVFGTVRAFDAPVTAGSIELVRSGGALASLPLDSNGRFSGWAFAGTYDVYYASPGGGDLPAGRVLAAASHVPGTALDIVLDVATVRGEVRVDGRAPSEGPRGTVDFVHAGGRARLELASTGPATFEGRLFVAGYDVWVDGEGAGLPSVAEKVLSGWAAVEEPLLIDLRTTPVSIRLTHDGGPFPVFESGGSNGILTITRVDDGGRPMTAGGGLSGAEPLAQVVDVPRGASPRVDLSLPAGRYAVRYDGPNDGAMPPGTALLGTFDVGTTTSPSFDVRTALVTVQLRNNGEWLPPGTSSNRGWLAIGPAWGFVRSNGTSEITLWVVRGEYDLHYTCQPGDGCAARVPSRALLASGIAF